MQFSFQSWLCLTSTEKWTLGYWKAAWASSSTSQPQPRDKEGSRRLSMSMQGIPCGHLPPSMPLTPYTKCRAQGQRGHKRLTGNPTLQSPLSPPCKEATVTLGDMQTRTWGSRSGSFLVSVQPDLLRELPRVGFQTGFHRPCPWKSTSTRPWPSNPRAVFPATIQLLPLRSVLFFFIPSRAPVPLCSCLALSTVPICIPLGPPCRLQLPSPLLPHRSSHPFSCGVFLPRE